MAVGSVQISGTGQLIEVSRRLKAAGGPRLKQNFTRRIRRAGEPLHRDIQNTIRTLPIEAEPRKPNKHGVIPRSGASPTTRPLRALIAEAVRLSVRTGSTPGARIWLDRSTLPPDLKFMPEAMNKPNGRIRHPVFGNRKRWVNQWTTPMWWDKTVARHTPRMQAEVARVLDDVRRDLT